MTAHAACPGSSEQGMAILRTSPQQAVFVCLFACFPAPPWTVCQGTPWIVVSMWSYELLSTFAGAAKLKGAVSPGPISVGCLSRVWRPTSTRNKPINTIDPVSRFPVFWRRKITSFSLVLSRSWRVFVGVGVEEKCVNKETMGCCVGTLNSASPRPRLCHPLPPFSAVMYHIRLPNRFSTLCIPQRLRHLCISQHHP